MRRLVLLAALCLGVAACGGSSDAGTGEPAPATDQPRTGPLTPTDPSRISAEQAAAIAHLGEVADTAAPTGHHHGGHSDAGPYPTVVLPPQDQAGLDRQWAAARRAATNLDTPEEAAEAGYVRAAAQGPGVGVHWVKWSLVDAPFDPEQPAMLLFDERGGAAELAGFSYWLLSDDEPAGFAGANDHWHQHTGLCIVNGWVDREMSAGPEACAGTYLGGADLWMLHAWVVEGYENRWGDFAVMNPRLCPSVQQTPELARCPDDFTL